MYLKNEYSFERYCEKFEEKIYIEGKKVYYYASQRKKVANAFPEIISIEILELSDNFIIFTVEFELSKKNGYELQCDVKFFWKNKRVDFVDNQFQNLIQDSGIKVADARMFYALCKRYFSEILNQERSKLSPKKIGWRHEHEQKHFIPVTSDGGWSIFDNSIFGHGNRNESKFFCEKNKAEIIAKTDSFKTLFECLSKSGTFMGIFSYTLFSMLLHYIYIEPISFYIKESIMSKKIFNSLIFSISICSSKNDNARKVANIFSNVFHVDMKKSPNERGNSYLSATSLKFNLKTLMEIESIPVIITSKTPLYRNSSIIKRLHINRERDVIRSFPVYICNTPINADEIIDFKIDTEISLLGDSQNWQILKDEVSYLLLKYVLFLSGISERRPQHMEDYNYISQLFESTFEKISNKEILDDEDVYWFYLYIAFGSFCYFLEKNMELSEYAQQLKKQAYSFFIEKTINDRSSAIAIAPKINENEILKDFWCYVQKLFESTENDGISYLHWQGTDRSTKEECYYLSFTDFYSDYAKSDKAKKFVSEIDLKNLLKEHGLIVMRKEKTQASVLRTYQGKKESVLAIKKDIYEQFVKSIIEKEIH